MRLMLRYVPSGSHNTTNQAHLYTNSHSMALGEIPRHDAEGVPEVEQDWRGYAARRSQEHSPRSPSGGGRYIYPPPASWRAFRAKCSAATLPPRLTTGARGYCSGLRPRHTSCTSFCTDRRGAKRRGDKFVQPRGVHWLHEQRPPKDEPPSADIGRENRSLVAAFARQLTSYFLLHARGHGCHRAET